MGEEEGCSGKDEFVEIKVPFLSFFFFFLEFFGCTERNQ